MTRYTIEVGSIIDIPHHIKIKSKYPYPDDNTLDVDLDQIQIYKIKGEEVTYDFPYNKGNNWRTTFDELERVGVLEKDVFEVGDEVACINLTNQGKDNYHYFSADNIKIGDKLIISYVGDRLGFKGKRFIFDKTSFKKVKKESMKVGDIFTMKRYAGLCTVVGDAKNWDEGTISAGTYQIKKLTATQVYFEGENYKDTNFWILKKPVFESIAVFKTEDKTITGYKFKTGSVDATVGTLVSLDGYYTNTKGEKAHYDPSFLTNTTWFEPVYAAIYKQGDLVTDDDCKNVYVYSHQTGTQHYSVGDPMSFGNKLRHLTPAEIKEYEESKRVIKGLGRNGITLIWDGKDSLLIKEKRDYLSLSKLRTWFDSLPKIISIGDYTISLFDKDARVFLVGCTGEQNYVSYNEIKKVIDFCK